MSDDPFAHALDLKLTGLRLESAGVEAGLARCETLDAQATLSRRDAALRAADDAFLALLDDAHRDSRGGVDADLARASAAAWDADLWARHEPPATDANLPRVSRMGQLRVPASDTVLPALVPFLGSGNIAFVCDSDGLERGRRAASALVFRALVTAPPGRVHLYLVDAAGSGNAFHELNRFADPVRQRPGKDTRWPASLDAVLGELEAHIHEVNDRYLAGQYPDLWTYNQEPKELQQNYRILAVSDLPYRFERAHIERLSLIARNGPRAGVFVVAVVDSSQQLPHGMRPEHLTRGMLALTQGKGQAFSVPGLPGAELHPEALPPGRNAWLDRLVELVTARARDATRISIPLLGYKPEQLWTASAMTEIRAPIGRSAERADQEFLLNEASLPHGLVAGATGRGKTVLLNSLILGLCWRYSPEELQLYLLDFKDGLGFQGFRELPHASLVALRGERELGLNVLKDLERAFRERMALFKRTRGAGGGTVNNIATYRAATGLPMPRVLVVFDEFQTLLRGEDDLAAECAALLATLASQGREVGIHLLLATQTPRGSGLSAAIQSQLATRIALFLEEADSVLVLAGNNRAAAMLHRQGEALYNSQGGDVTGNNRFQVAFVDKAAIPSLVHELAELAADRYPGRAKPRVQDGNEPISPMQVPVIARAARHAPTELPRTLRAYVGAPVDLETDHIHAVLQRGTRCHVMLLGRNRFDGDEDFEPLSVMLAALATAALQAAAGPATVRLASLMNADDPLFDLPDRLRAVPGDVVVGGEPDLRRWIEELAAELAHRKAEPTSARAPILLGIFGIQRAGFLDAQAVKAPPHQEKLRALLVEGSEWGIHLIVHADDPSQLARRINATDQREFGTRIVVRGGPGRKLFDNARYPIEDVPAGFGWIERQEQIGTIRRFRTYGPDIIPWLDTLGSPRGPVTDRGNPP